MKIYDYLHWRNLIISLIRDGVRASRTFSHLNCSGKWLYWFSIWHSNLFTVQKICFLISILYIGTMRCDVTCFALRVPRRACCARRMHLKMLVYLWNESAQHKLQIATAKQQHAQYEIQNKQTTQQKIDENDERSRHKTKKKNYWIHLPVRQTHRILYDERL